LVQGVDQKQLTMQHTTKLNKEKMKRGLQSMMPSSNGLQETAKMKQKMISHYAETNTRT
jgi:hypothetical protein